MNQRANRKERAMKVWQINENVDPLYFWVIEKVIPVITYLNLALHKQKENKSPPRETILLPNFIPPWLNQIRCCFSWSFRTKQ